MQIGRDKHAVGLLVRVTQPVLAQVARNRLHFHTALVALFRHSHLQQQSMRRVGGIGAVTVDDVGLPPPACVFGSNSASRDKFI